MNDALIQLFALAFTTIGPLIPGAIRTAENYFGHSGDGDEKKGVDKRQMALDLLTVALQTLAKAEGNKVPSEVVEHPAMPAALVAALQLEFDRMKTAGELGPVPSPAKTPALPPTDL
jgi:hypothetical protein